MKLTNKKLWKILSRTAIVLALLIFVATVFTGCMGSAAPTTKDLSSWAGENYAEGDNILNLEDNKAVELKEEKGPLTWIGTFLRWITVIMPAHSYILALLIFAIIVEFILLPFSIKQQKTSIKQAMLRPKEMAIRKKYAGRNDQKTQQIITQEIQELYQKENYSPLSGCLPLLIQLPVIMVLYSVVTDPVKYILNVGGDFTNFMKAYFFVEGGIEIKSTGSIELLGRMAEKWNSDPGFFNNIYKYCDNGDAVRNTVIEVVEGAPNFFVGPFNMGYIPSFKPSDNLYWWFLAIPVLTFVVYFLTSKLQRKFTFQPTQNADNRQQACSNNMMDVMMPLMSVYFTFVMPAAIAVYWMFKSVLGFVKTVILSKVMPLPTFTDEDYKAAEKELAGKTPKKVQKSERAGTVRSLHHIDDEDYDEKGNYIGNEKQLDLNAEEEEEPKKQEMPENNMTEGATLKDESDKAEKKEKKSLFGRKKKNKDADEK